MLGTVIYDNETNRLDVLLTDGTTYGGLHCSDVIEIYVGDCWRSVRVIKNSDWYLVDGFAAGSIPTNLLVRLP